MNRVFMAKSQILMQRPNVRQDHPREVGSDRMISIWPSGAVRCQWSSYEASPDFGCGAIVAISMVLWCVNRDFQTTTLARYCLPYHLLRQWTLTTRFRQSGWALHKNEVEIHSMRKLFRWFQAVDDDNDIPPSCSIVSLLWHSFQPHPRKLPDSSGTSSTYLLHFIPTERSSSEHARSCDSADVVFSYY